MVTGVGWFVRIADEHTNSKRNQEHMERLEGSLATKITERDRILELFRKGLINENDLERQLDQIGREEAALRANIEDVSARLRGVADGAAQLQSAEALLEKLRGRLDAGNDCGVSYAFVAPERQNELTMRIRERPAIAGSKGVGDAIEPPPFTRQNPPTPEVPPSLAEMKLAALAAK